MEKNKKKILTINFALTEDRIGINLFHSTHFMRLFFSITLKLKTRYLIVQLADYHEISWAHSPKKFNPFDINDPVTFQCFHLHFTLTPSK